MLKIFPILGVCFLLLGGFGAVALPIEKHIVETPIDIDDWLLEIKILGGFLGYEVTVENLGSEQVYGDLSIELTTDAEFIFLGKELYLNFVFSFLTAVAYYFSSDNNYLFIYVALVFLFFASFFDMIDGSVARAYREKGIHRCDHRPTAEPPGCC